MAMTRPDFDFLAKIMKEQVDASTQGSLGEQIKIAAFRALVVRIDEQYLNFRPGKFMEAAGIARLEGKDD